MSSDFSGIDKRIANLRDRVAGVKRAPLLAKAPLVEKVVDDLLELLALMVAELKARKPVYCDAGLIIYCKCGFEVRTNPENPLVECPNCARPLRQRDAGDFRSIVDNAAR